MSGPREPRGADDPGTLVGRLEVRVVDAGSKGEMPAAVLVTGDGAVPLRRAGTDRLDADPELAAYDGRLVRVTGHRAWRTFVVDTIAPEEDSEL